MHSQLSIKNANLVAIAVSDMSLGYVRLWPRAKGCVGGLKYSCEIARAEPDGTRAETRFRLSPKRTSPFKSAGE